MMADSDKPQEIKVSVSKTAAPPAEEASAEDATEKIKPAQPKAEPTADKHAYMTDDSQDEDESDEKRSDRANRTGKIISPSADSELTAEAEEPNEQPEPAADSSPSDKPAVEQPASEQATEDTINDSQLPVAAPQPQIIEDNRDYKISKKQLKRSPRTSSRHAHKTSVYVGLVVLVSLAIVAGYMLAAGVSLQEITTKLG